jgi:hypothetical protein
MHGPHTVIEEVLDWRPFDYVTTLLPIPDALNVILTYAFLENAIASQRLTKHFAGHGYRKDTASEEER